jgi:hypothetical protein
MLADTYLIVMLEIILILDISERLAREQFEQEENEEAERKAAEKAAEREEGEDHNIQHTATFAIYLIYSNC